MLLLLLLLVLVIEHENLMPELFLHLAPRQRPTAEPRDYVVRRSGDA